MLPVKMRSLSPIMERHTPQHPLPEELKELPEDETVCQFCGVSYLIHHEIKKLEDKVAELEGKLEKANGFQEREIKLRDEIKKGKDGLNVMNGVLADRDNLIEKITQDYEKEKNMNVTLTDQVKRIVEENIQLQRILKSSKHEYCQNLKKITDYARSLRLSLEVLTDDFKSACADILQLNDTASLQVQQLSSMLNKEYSSLTSENQTLKSRLLSAEATDESWKLKHDSLEKEVLMLRKDAERSSQSLQDSKSKMEEDLHTWNTKYKEMSMEAKKQELHAKTAQMELKKAQEKFTASHDQLQLDLIKARNSEGDANQTIRRLTQETRDMEKELHAVKLEHDRLKTLHSKSERTADSLKEEAALKNSETKQLQEMLDEAREAVAKIISERELMVTSHQNQIQQLKDNFRKKLEASQALPIKAQEELQKAEQRLQEALQEQKVLLQKDFEIELSVERDKCVEAISDAKAKHKVILREAEDSYNVREKSHNHEIACLKQKIEMMTKEFDVKNKQCNKEKESLKKMISELEARITNLTGENEDSHVLNKMEVGTIQKKIDEVEKYNQELKTDIQKLTQENSFLQDTVRRECEERFELTEALSYISEQLKSNKITLDPSLAMPVSLIGKKSPGKMPRCSTIKELGIPEALRSSSQTASRSSLPDLLPNSATKLASPKVDKKPSPVTRREPLAGSRGYSPTPANTREITFSGDATRARNGHSSSSSNGSTGGGRAPESTQMKSPLKTPDGVDSIRQRIAAAIKSKRK